MINPNKRGDFMDINNILTEKTDKLIGLIKQVDTLDVIGMVCVEFQLHYDGKDVFERTKLISPFKQYIYLLNLLLSNPQTETSTGVDFKTTYEEIKKLLNEIAQIYGLIFFPEENEEISDSWYKHRELAMPVFMNYFNTHSLPYEEQLIDRIQQWASPYDSVIIDKFGCSVNEFIEMYRYLVKMLQKQLDDYQNGTDNFFEKLLPAYKYFNKLIKNEKMNSDLAMQKTREVFPLDNLENPFTTIFFKINFNKFEEKFTHEKVMSFLNHFSVGREEREFYYYTESGPFDNKPIIKHENEYYIPISKQILHAFENQFFNAIEESNRRTSFFRNRDRKSEEKTLEIFKRLLGKNAEYFSSIYERPDSQNEHDLLIKTNKGTIYIIEVKASKFKEPFRNPDKAYERIKRDFKSDGGIQKAYDQAKRLYDLIIGQEVTNLYNQSGQLITTINSKEINDIYIICVTAENFGVIASNLSYLLEKEKSDRFPYAVNIFDLESIVEYLEFKKLSPNILNDYLDFRSRFQEKFIAFDELDIFGLFMSKPNIDQLIKADKVIVNHEYSDIFDEMYFTKLGIIKKSQKQKKNTFKKANKKSKKKIEKASRRRNRKKR